MEDLTSKSLVDKYQVLLTFATSQTQTKKPNKFQFHKISTQISKQKEYLKVSTRSILRR